jgi:serine/threonine-protein kinase
MGSVWAGTHLALDTPVAIKFMTWTAPQVEASASREPEGEEDPVERRTRFEREAKAAAQIRSANVVQVFDYGVDRGVPFIVMELLEGEDLHKRLQREGRLSPEATARLMQAVARALQRAHDMGLVHRDLKPGNIFLAKEGDHEVPKVVDFGVVKALPGQHKLGTEGSENTVEGTLIGTPSYMSPEQAMGRSNVDHRSDLWSLGVIIFQTLTGMKPFASGHLFEALVRICSDPIPRASSIVADLPAGVDAFFERALERGVGKRLQSAREMERAFYALIARPSNSLPPDAAALGGTGRLEEARSEATVRDEWTATPRRSFGRLLVIGFVAAGALVIAAALVASREKRAPAPAGPPSAVAESTSTSPLSSASVLSAPDHAPPENSALPPAPPEVVSAAPSSRATPGLVRSIGSGHPSSPGHNPPKPKRDLGY